MPIVILDSSPRVPEVGRIRCGEYDGAPRAADRLIFTSTLHAPIQQVSELYGGHVEKYSPQGTGGVDGYRCKIKTETVPVTVPGKWAFSQWLEQWGRGGCIRRCDGVTEQLSGKPCLCNPENRDCDPQTRILLSVDGVTGYWRLDSGSWTVAREMAGVLNLYPGAFTAELTLRKTRIKNRTTFIPTLIPLQAVENPVVESPPTLENSTTVGETTMLPSRDDLFEEIVTLVADRMSLTELEQDFTEWSGGCDIYTANPNILAEYRDIQRKRSERE